jgi:serine/threonine protein kinase
MPISQQRLGEYVLMDCIGVGAFGEVWRARHHAWADQIVAVKIPTDPEYVKNLQKEGFAIQRLSHPCIVKPISFDPYANPPYLVMEYVPGWSLRQFIQQGPMKIDDAAAVMKQVLAALHHAHHNGLVHRDIKPENILIHEKATRNGLSAKGVVKLTDFGLGKTTIRSEQSIIFSEDQRDARRIVGSGPYMSPEQLDGAEVDAQTDLYACGVVFFEMLTGKRPAGAEMPSELNAAVPTAIDEVFRRAFARKERRFATAEEFYNAMKTATGTPLYIPVRKSASRRPHFVVIGAIVTAVAAIAIASLLIVYPSQSVPAPTPPDNNQPVQAAVTPPPITPLLAPSPIPVQPAPVAASPDIQEQSGDSVPTPEFAPTIDLLKLADVAQDTVSGRWSLSDGSLIGYPQRPWSRFEFMYRPPGEYDYRVVFTRTEGDDIILFFCYAFGHQFAFDLASDHNKTNTFDLIDGEYFNLTTRHSKECIVNGRRYTCVIKVRKDGVSVFLDGTLISEWKTDYHDMSLAGGWSLRRGDIIGLGNADNNRTVFHSVEVVEVSGKGEFLRQTTSTPANLAAPVVVNDIPAFFEFGPAMKIVYICDASGSMLSKMELLKRELLKSVDELQPTQAFDVLFFQDSPRNPKSYLALAPNMMMATPDNKRKLYAFLREIRAQSSTHVIPALTAACNLPTRPDLIYLLTDGAFEDETGPVVVRAIERLNADKRIKIDPLLLINPKEISDDELREASDTMRTIASENGGVYPPPISVEEPGN